MHSKRMRGIESSEASGTIRKQGPARTTARPGADEEAHFAEEALKLFLRSVRRSLTQTKLIFFFFFVVWESFPIVVILGPF